MAFSAYHNLRVKLARPRPKKIQVFVDFDDTLIPTSVYLYRLEEKSIMRNNYDFKKCISDSVNLELFDETLYKFLIMLKELGDLKILTCSDRGWPEMVCDLLFPEIIKNNFFNSNNLCL